MTCKPQVAVRILSTVLVIRKLLEKLLLNMTPIRFAILTISDTCASEEKTDESGPALKAFINSTNATGNIFKGDVCYTAIVQDDETSIVKQLIDWSDKNKIDVILTTGGTGLSERDVTPEATKKVIYKEIPGMSIAMLTSSLKITPMAMLSRAVCGIRGKTLIINLPGSRKAATECLSVIIPAIPHAMDLILNNKAKIKDTHKSVQCNVSSCSHMSGTKNLMQAENAATRLRKSPFPMISVEDAIEILRKNVEETEAEIININDAQGRILYQNIKSYINLPPFRASIKDGYAVLASDGKGKRRVLCGVKAGTMSIPVHLEPGTCVRVNTGAPIPDEATAVVQVEDTKLLLKNSDGTEEEEIEIMTQPINGQDIRPIGSDIEVGKLILTPYTCIGPVEIGILAATGCKDIRVMKLPSVGVLSTGDELQEAGEPLRLGHVYDSNRITLISLLQENGFRPLDFGIAIDEEIIMVQKIKEAIEKVDVLVTTGSVSMGDRDIMKPILQKYFKAVIHFGRVNMKPGKPTTFATCEYLSRKKYFFCLPGNPVSAIVTARLFLLPFLNYMQGNFPEPVIVQTKLTSSYNLDPRPEYVSVILRWDNKESLPYAYRVGDQISSRLLSCKDGNAFLILPGRTAEKYMLIQGDIVSAMLIGFK